HKAPIQDASATILVWFCKSAAREAGRMPALPGSSREHKAPIQDASATILVWFCKSAAREAGKMPALPGSTGLELIAD
ncbi:MAG: hypothetical protein K2X77_19920, partial [Candidatus Obscuribacterales bacterium]|nr:hypothetical protein [Candidatus Obscuribacterales bacterium]